MSLSDIWASVRKSINAGIEALKNVSLSPLMPYSTNNTISMSDKIKTVVQSNFALIILIILSIFFIKLWIERKLFR